VATWRASARIGAWCTRAEKDHLLAIRLVEEHPDHFVLRGWQVLADVVRTDRQLAVTTVDEDRELYGAWAPDVIQRVERGAYGPA